MQLEIRKRAEGVVKRFEEMLPEEVAAHIERDHFDELVLLVEAAIGDIYTTTMHDTAKQLETLAKEYRTQASVITEKL